MSSISREKAIEIAKEFANKISLIKGDSLVAIYAIGSLGGGYYRPGQSDIDTLIIFDDKVDYNKSVIKKVAEDYQKKYDIPKGFGAVIVHKNQLYPPYDKTDELVLEIINLKKQGLPVYGSFDTDSIPMPDREAIIEDANAFEDWRDKELTYSKSLLPMAACVNSILILLKRYLLIEKGIVEFNKFKIINTYLNNEPPVVNKEIFQLTDSYINAKDYKDERATEQELNKMNVFHDELKLTMNKLLLSR